jgi:hypothetical protein
VVVSSEKYYWLLQVPCSWHEYLFVHIKSAKSKSMSRTEGKTKSVPEVIKLHAGADLAVGDEEDTALLKNPSGGAARR